MTTATCEHCYQPIYLTMGGEWRHDHGYHGCFGGSGEVATPRETAKARHTDPPTSHEAAASVKDLRGSQKAVLQVFPQSGSFGLTDEELVTKYKNHAVQGDVPIQSESGIRTRRSELVRKGLVVDSGHLRFTVSGRKAIVWRKA